MLDHSVDRSRGAALAVVALAAACGGGDTHYATAEELMDPAVCAECHPRHYEEWQSSMHAYAAEDPVFLAMNARGQEETDGELGEFCVNCHAPMAVRLGLTHDGLDLDAVPDHQKGVTCYFCHNAIDARADHNNGLVLADDNVLRGGFGDPLDNGFHRSEYSDFHDRRRPRSSDMCGSCHDIVNGHGVRIERTFEEFKTTIFATAEQGKLSCSGCHMVGFDNEVVADFDGVGTRTRHEHTFPGVDVALTPWPGGELQLAGIERDLFPSIIPTLCVTPEPLIRYRLDNVFAGHMIPSGAAADRRVWMEIKAYTDDTVAWEFGAVAEGQPMVDVVPKPYQIRDHFYDGDGNEVHMFWEAESYESNLLPPSVTNDPSDPRFFHSVDFDFPEVIAATADRVEAVVHIRPIGLDVLDDLIASGHLDPEIRDEVPTFTLEPTRLVWRKDVHGFGECATRLNQP